MALIKCSECGKEVSSKAESCPQCGNPISTKPITDAGIGGEPVTTIQQTSQTLKLQGLFSFLLIVVSIIVAFKSYISSGETPKMWLSLVICGSIWHIVIKVQVWFYHE